MRHNITASKLKWFVITKINLKQKLVGKGKLNL
jgi:hypothetical protein